MTQPLNTVAPGAAEIIRKDPIIKAHVFDPPIVEEVIEHRTVEVHHKPVIIEIHEQPIIEIERKKQTNYVNDDDDVRMYSHDYEMEDPNVRLTAEERRLVESLLTKSTSTVRELEVREGIKHTVREQVTHIDDTPIIRTVNTSPVITQQTVVIKPTTHIVETKTIERSTVVESATVQSETIVKSTFLGGVIRKISSGGSDHVYGLLEDGTLYRMRYDKQHGWYWSLYEEIGVVAFDLSVSSDGGVFIIAESDRLLYRLTEEKDNVVKIERYVSSENIRLRSIAAANNDSVYALTEAGLVVHLFNNRNIAKMSGRLKMISIGGPVKHLFKANHYEFWAIGLDNKPYQWNGKNNWDKVSEMEVIDIHVAKDLTVYAVNTNGVVLLWNTHRKAFDIQEIENAKSIRFKSISAYKMTSNVYGIQDNGKLVTLTGK